MTENPRPTLKTIAQMTGLAVPTVSRALSGAKDIGEHTRDRVQKIAQEIGYVPNRAGLRLRTGRNYVISLLLSPEVEVMNFTARLINGAASALRNTQYHLTITPCFADEDPMRALRHVVETNAADAVIFNQTLPQDPRVQYLMERNFPFATHGRTEWSDQHAYYDYDNGVFARLAVRHLAAKGRRSIGIVAPPPSIFYGQEMISAATDEAKAQGVELHVFQTVTSEDPVQKVEVSMATKMQQGRRFDGMIFGSANSCMAGVSGLEQAGLRIGEDVDVFSKESANFLQRFRSPIHSVQEDALTAGAFLARAAIARIEQPEKPLMQQVEIPQER